MAIDINGADLYFKADNHPRAAIWAGFKDESADLQKAAIANAKRLIAMTTKKDPDDNLPADPTDPTEFPRFDFATYEQALFDLENGIIADGAQATAKFIAGRTKKDEARERSTDTIAPLAMQWLFRGRITFTRS